MDAKPAPDKRLPPARSHYARLADFLDDRPDFAADWRTLTLVLALGYCVTLGVRLLETPNWDIPGVMAGGERILATHDAYCWLAGAKGVNSYADFGMSRLAALLSGITGQPLWAVGFFAPAFLGSLTAVAAGLWGWLLGGRRAVLIPALMGALSPGFYFRSRLGYYDSDVFTQLMPLLLGFFLAALIAPYCSRAWRATQQERENPAAPPPCAPWLAFCFGLVARVAHFAHDDIHPLGVGLFWLALGLLALGGLRGKRTAGLGLLVVYGLAAYAGQRHFGFAVFAPTPADLAGIALAALSAWMLWCCTPPAGPPPDRISAWFATWGGKPWPWLAALAALALACGLLLPLGAFWAKALSYFKPVAEAGLAVATAGGPPPSYPGITQSIREAKNVADIATALAGLSVGTTLGVASLLGVLAMLALRPAALLLAPMVLLGFASMVLGTRFTMFGGPVFALGLGLGLHWTAKALARRFGRGEGLLPWCPGLVAAACLLFGYIPLYMDTRPTPVLSAAHAEALQACRTFAPRDADIWTWWDYGYATQYFAERTTPTDGGRHAGRDIYATALALTTDSFRQASQVIRLSAGQGNDPARRWDAMPARDVRAELSGMRGHDLGLPDTRPQLLVVCWENLTLLYWISFYGTWDVVSGQAKHAAASTLRESVNLDRTAGEVVRNKNGSRVPLASAEILSQKGLERIALPERQGGAHLLVNERSNQAMLLDDLAYNSMAVQLLVGDPARPEQARYFKLLHEDFPLVRIYEVLPEAKISAQAKAAHP